MIRYTVAETRHYLTYSRPELFDLITSDMTPYEVESLSMKATNRAWFEGNYNA